MESQNTICRHGRMPSCPHGLKTTKARVGLISTYRAEKHSNNAKSRPSRNGLIPPFIPWLCAVILNWLKPIARASWDHERCHHGLRRDIPDPGFSQSQLDPGSWIQAPGSRLLDPGSWVLDHGCRLQLAIFVDQDAPSHPDILI